MKVIVAMLLGLVVLGLGFWAYQENYRTRAALDDLNALQRDLVRMTEERAMLRAEWAWLNRPERLEVLVLANKGSLQLMNMVPEHFGTLEQVGYPTRARFSGPAELRALAREEMTR